MKTLVLLGAIALLAVFVGILLAGLAAKARQWEMREKKDKQLHNQLNNGHRINGGFRTRPRRG
jgi:nitrogen fixation-related uncharacterized protein